MARCGVVFSLVFLPCPDLANSCVESVVPFRLPPPAAHFVAIAVARGLPNAADVCIEETSAHGVWRLSAETECRDRVRRLGAETE